MSYARRGYLRDAEGSGDHWPGFVDALATLLLVIIFLLAVFVVGQVTLSQALSGRDEELASLNARLATLAEELNIAESENEQLSLRIDSLTEERDALESELASTSARLAEVSRALAGERELSEEAARASALLTAQIASLRDELASLNAALEASEAREAELEAEVVNLGRRLNAALAAEVSRLAAYRSDFFAKLVDILGNRSGVRVVGDRFVFETDVLFPSASATLSDEGRQALMPIADAIIQLTAEIPDDVDWVVRVDGHTDWRPLGPSAQFSSNWELSTARSLSVINWLEDLGVPPEHLMAAGFGEHHPIAEGRSAEANARNRRIELKLTAR
jgi:chemotaxis protein MotB